MTLSKIEILEREQSQTNDYNEMPPSDIIAYNELRSCADLYRMHQKNILQIRPFFQRDIAWKDNEQTRFIDSLIKQLPIPSMCFGYDPKKQIWIVIDGLQRMHTIVRFLGGKDWTLSRLGDVDGNISGQNVETIADEHSSLHQYYMAVENLTVPITVLRFDSNKKQHLEYMFTIFHRLNTGGSKLTNQEIRNCIYSGPFNELLRELDQNQYWRRINKMQPGANYRFSKQELILRFLAFNDSYKKYNGSLVRFLNEFMAENRFIEENTRRRYQQLFQDVVEVTWLKMMREHHAQKMTLTFIEALLVGIARNVEKLKNDSDIKKAKLFDEFAGSDLFSEGSLVEGLSHTKKVIDRMEFAISHFSK